MPAVKTNAEQMNLMVYSQSQQQNKAVSGEQCSHLVAQKEGF